MDGIDRHGPAAPQAAAAAWLEAFGAALRRQDASAAAGLFLDDGHWRDVLAYGLGTLAFARWLNRP